jgi:hypothetical protein
LFIKLEIELLEQLSQLVSTHSTSLFVEINGELVEKVEISELINNNHSLTSSFISIDLKEIVQRQLDSFVQNTTIKKINFLTHDFDASPVDLLNIKMFINLPQQSDSTILSQLFSTIHQTVALNIKFGQQNKELFNNKNNKRRDVGHYRYRKTKTSNDKEKVYRECADLKRAGFAKSNYTCCRETISFSIEQIGWSHWILSPKVIEYKYCRGGCLCKYF